MPQERELEHKSVADALVMNIPKRRSSAQPVRSQSARPTNNRLMQQNYYRTQNQCVYYIYDDEKQKKKTVTSSPFYFTRYKQRTGSMSTLPSKNIGLGSDFPGARQSQVYFKKEPNKGNVLR